MQVFQLKTIFQVIEKFFHYHLQKKTPTILTQFNETGTPDAPVVVSVLSTFPFAFIVPQLPVQTGACFLQEGINIKTKTSETNI